VLSSASNGCEIGSLSTLETMLSVAKYGQEYIDACRARVDAQVSVYQRLLEAAITQGGNALHSAVEEIEPEFFNNMVIVLNGYFMHRARAIEGKDGNPLNEVRMLTNSLMENDGVFTSDSTIKLNPLKTVLKYRVGDAILIGEHDFVLLSQAFFSEIESRFTVEDGKETP
jgi:hypothetical protein